MKNKKIILPLILLSLIFLCSFTSTKNHVNYHKNLVTSYKHEIFYEGFKNFDEVRIIRSKGIVKVWTDVITKYRKSIPDPPGSPEVQLAFYKEINLLLHKYH